MWPGNDVSPRGLAVPSYLTAILWVLFLTGCGVFLAGVLGPQPLRAWQAYYINFLYWSGISFGAVLFTAVLNMTAANWGRPLKRIAEAFGAFLPAGFVLFWPLWLGSVHLIPWAHQSVGSRALWLNIPFLFLRNGFSYLVLSVISLALIAFSLKEECGRTKTTGAAPEDCPDARQASAWRKQLILSPVLAIVYCFAMSLMGFDLVMSLDPGWASTLFGGYFFIGSFYTAITAICLVAFVSRNAEGLRTHLGPRHFHDLGKLMFAFCLFTGYLFYSQFLVIWYGNIPAETRYVILRVKLTPWEPIAWVVLTTVFAVPFVFLLSKKIKLKRLPMTLLCIVILVGMWLERFILVAPSLWKQDGVPLGIMELLITGGYLGLVGLCLTTFLRRFPVLPLSDPLFRQSLETDKERLAP